jgi:SRSO17 transposase
VYLTYADPAGSAFIDRAVHLPRSWTGDPTRCAAAGIPEGTAFATKPALARAMIAGALVAVTPTERVTADEVYGQDPQLRGELARHGLGYVLAIPKRHRSSCRRCLHGGRAGPAAAGPGLAAGLGRARRQGAPLARLGVTGFR